jgi:hypothetical protein
MRFFGQSITRGVERLARFEATVVKGKRRELWYYNSRLLRLTRETAAKLQTGYKNKSRRPDWYIHFGFYKVFGFQNVPAVEFSNLKETFKDYIDRVLEVKRHRHRFVFVKKDSTWIWLKCAGCDAVDQIVYNNYERVAKGIILPYWLSLERNRPLYRSGWERRRIHQFLTEYKERAIQSVAVEIDRQVLELREKLERARSEKKRSTLQEQIQGLLEEREAYELADLIL